jgi:uncharacterized BrkB/YihY/UPF0761 family membrane protein
MTRRRNIALVAGAIATLAVFLGGMALIILGGFLPDNQVIFFASIALAPMAMLSVMVGYCVWWLVLFVLSLILPNDKPVNGPR